MDEAALVNLSKRRSDADGEAQKRRSLPGLSHQPQQGLAARVLDQERKPPFARLQPQGPGGPGRIELALATHRRVAAARRFRARAAPTRARRRGEGKVRHPIRPATGRTPRPPKGLRRMCGRSRHARASQTSSTPQAIRPRKQSTGVRRNLTDVAKRSNLLSLTGISRKPSARVDCRDAPINERAIAQIAAPKLYLD